MSIDKVKAYFKKFSMEDRVIEFNVSSATVGLAAGALGVEEGEIAKTMSFLIKDRAILIVTAGDVRVDNKKFKAEFGSKLKMIKPENLNELIGHEMGGVCPFAVKEEVEVYLDKSLKKYKTIYPACGSANSAIALSIEELEKYSNPVKWVDVC